MTLFQDASTVDVTNYHMHLAGLRERSIPGSIKEKIFAQLEKAASSGYASTFLPEKAFLIEDQEKYLLRVYDWLSMQGLTVSAEEEPAAGLRVTWGTINPY